MFGQFHRLQIYRTNGNSHVKKWVIDFARISGWSYLSPIGTSPEKSVKRHPVLHLNLGEKWLPQPS